VYCPRWHKMWMGTCNQMQKTGLTSIAIVSVLVDGVYTHFCILETLNAKKWHQMYWGILHHVWFRSLFYEWQRVLVGWQHLLVLWTN
jgi:hypothetical protein